jgi:DNA modification methylase
MPDNSVDSIVTDPPYGLSFMGKKWDYDVPSQEIWEECLRVLKPGGYLLAFAGTRTQHRMAVRIEDAGFEIRDMIAWIYGSGFPKSLNIGKSVNQLETNEWTKISKALDNMQKTDIIRVWKSNSNNVNIVRNYRKDQQPKLEHIQT